MTAAKHTSPRDPSFRRSLLRTAGGAVGLVVGVAAIFGVLGMIGRDDTDPVVDVADGPEEPADIESAPTDEAAGEDPANGGDEPSEASEADAGEQPADEDGSGGAPGTEEPDEAPEEDPDEAPDEDPDEASSEESAPSEPRIDPASISVQVLDGYRQDGGTAAGEVYEQLDSAGYNIIARNPAIAYEVTTVLWTAGHEAEGRQVAQEIGAAEAREQPGNLSTQVNVHVVVGADRG